MTELIHYDAAFRELMAAESVDEVKELRDKAIALEAYAKQAMNTEMERAAVNIRIRAEREAGKMMQGMERAEMPNPEGNNQVTGHGEPQPKSEFAQAKESAGISDTQAKRWQKLAEVEDDTFEKIMEGDDKPSTSGILKTQKVISSNIVWLMGRLRDFEKHPIMGMSFEEIEDQMTSEMVVRAKQQIPVVIGFLKDLEESLYE